MTKRDIVKIDEEKCTGCGQCVPNCAEGALQIIDGKARLISDLFCDGLGACLGHCPEGAISIEKREAEPYDERKVMEEMIPKGTATIRAHLEHLRDHGQFDLVKEGLAVLASHGIENPVHAPGEKMAPSCASSPGGCPGSKMMDFAKKKGTGDEEGTRTSQLAQWPVQLHLVPPTAPYFKGADVVLAADCVAYALADFHKDWLAGKSLAIACPKLDSEKEVYVEKITSLIDDAKINTLTVMMMEVPCCGGLLALVKKATEDASRKVPVKQVIVGIQGNIKNEEWVN